MGKDKSKHTNEISDITAHAKRTNKRRNRNIKSVPQEQSSLSQKGGMKFDPDSWAPEPIQSPSTTTDISTLLCNKSNQIHSPIEQKLGKSQSSKISEEEAIDYDMSI